MAPQNETYEMLDTSPSGGGGRGKLIAALIILLLLAGGVAAYFLRNRNTGPVETAGATTNSGGAPGTAPRPAATPAGTATAQPTQSPAATRPDGGTPTEDKTGTTPTGASGVVHFAVNRTEVLPADAGQVDAFYAKIKDGSGTINVEGHADNTGPEAHNQWLARARAEEVASLLRRKGVDKKYKINVSGFSSSKPLADNGTEDGRAKNRRVEVSYARGN